jgi:hypothetical protein
MNNPKTRDDDERSSIANQRPLNQRKTEKEVRRVVEGGEADQRSQHVLGENKAPKSQKEGPAAYAPLADEQSSADEARAQREKQQRQENQGGR